MTDLLAYRDRFPILEHTTYLINHSLGAMPAAVEERMREYARTWAERGIRAWGEGWWTTTAPPLRRSTPLTGGTFRFVPSPMTLPEHSLLPCVRYSITAPSSRSSSTRRT